MPDLKDILNDAGDLRDDELLKYLQGDLPRDEQHKVEQQIADSEFVSEALEGLQHIRNRRSIEQYVDDLNSQLHKQVTSKKKRKEKRKLKDNPWILVAVAAVLLLTVLSYIVVRYYQKHRNDPPVIENHGQ